MRDNRTRTEVVGVVGLGYIGLPLLAAFANVGYKVVGIDINKKLIDELKASKSDEMHIYEPGLCETIRRCSSNVCYESEYKDFMEKCDAIFITVGTPVKNDEPDYSFLNIAIDNIAKCLRKGQLIVLKSTVMPGTTEKVAKKLAEISGMRVGEDFYVAFCPERTIEGIALYELYNLPKIIGGINAESAERTANIIRMLGDKIVKVSMPVVAEMCKLVDNLYRAFNIGFANELGLLCEKMGFDSYELVRAVNSAYNRTQVFYPGLGADGPCLSKDPFILQHFATDNKIKTYMLESCIEINKYATHRLADLCCDYIEKKALVMPKIAFVGLAFKGNPETDDMRGSPSVKIYEEIYNRLLKKINIKCEFSFYDPIISVFKEHGVVDSYHEAMKGANVIMFLTDHRAVKNIHIDEIASIANKPLLIIDAWHNVDMTTNNCDLNDITYFRVGDGKWKY